MMTQNQEYCTFEHEVHNAVRSSQIVSLLNSEITREQFRYYFEIVTFSTYSCRHKIRHIREFISRMHFTVDESVTRIFALIRPVQCVRVRRILNNPFEYMLNKLLSISFRAMYS